MKYTVQISELLRHRIEIEANTAEQAIQKVKGDYYDSNIVLVADDYVDGSVQFEIIENG